MAFRIEHRIGVAAPPSEVWALIHDLPGWKDWTELYTEASGKIAIGETLRMVVKIGDQEPKAFDAVVYDWVPEAQLAWRARPMGMFLRTLRYIEIEKLSDTSCILSNGEYFFGLTFLIPLPLRGQIRQAFERMNENAKRICEARWTAKGGAPAAPVAEAVQEDVTIQPLTQRTMAGRDPWGFGGRKGGLLGPALNK